MEKVTRTYLIPVEVERALGLTAIDIGRERSTLIVEALRLYLPTVSTLPPVQAIAPGAKEKAA